jgi:hypothetical protein
VADFSQSLTISFGSSSASVEIGSNAAARFSVGDLLHLPQESVTTGAVRVTVNLPFVMTASNSSFVGILDIQNQSDVVTISGRAAGTDYTFANVVDGDGLFTGLAFATGNAAAKITIEVYRSNGGAPASATISLDGNQQFGSLLTELVPAAAIQTGGYIRVRSDQPIWTWSIYGSAPAMASGPPL